MGISVSREEDPELFETIDQELENPEKAALHQASN